MKLRKDSVKQGREQGKDEKLQKHEDAIELSTDRDQKSRAKNESIHSKLDIDIKG